MASARVIDWERALFDAILTLVAFDLAGLGGLVSQVIGAPPL